MNENNYNEINTLFEFTGNLVRDFHNSNTTCSFVDGVADGNIDDIKGLINFVRGEDYFDYRGGCGIRWQKLGFLSWRYRHKDEVEYQCY